MFRTITGAVLAAAMALLGAGIASATIPPVPLHYPLTGTITVKKPNAVVDLGKGALDAYYTIGSPPDYDAIVTGKLRLQPVQASFMIHGVVATAMVDFVPGPANVLYHKQKATGTAEMTLRIYDVRVGGVTLEVGPTCHTAAPAVATVASGPGFTLLHGGPVDGTFDIPPFNDCGITGSLDPLVTDLVSGPDNTISVEMRSPCTPRPGTGDCPWQDPNT